VDLGEEEGEEQIQEQEERLQEQKSAHSPYYLLTVIVAVLCGSALVCNADPDPAFYSLLLLPALLLHYTKLLRKKQKISIFL
jgi:hypothetical protein